MDLYSERVRWSFLGARALRWMGSVRGNTLFPGKPHQGLKLEVTLTIEGTGEGHVVQGSSWNPRPLVGGHSSDAVLSLLSWELPPQLLCSDVVLREKRY